MKVQLFEINPGLIKVNQALQWDVFSAQGKLLLHKGSVIQSDSQRDRLLELGMYVNKTDIHKPVAEGARQVYDPFYEWEDLRRRLARLNLAFSHAAHQPRPSPDLLAELDGVVTRIRTLVLKVPDVAIFEIMQLDTKNYVVAHHLQAAALSMLVAHALGWDEAALLGAGRVALTMNIAMLELQAVLAAQAQPVTPAQRQAIDEHCVRGRQLLEALGVSDLAWLDAVEGHHPQRTPGTPVSPLAQLVHHVDIYLAKISPRAYRTAKNPYAAARELLQNPEADKNLVSMLIKVVGIYPPGTYVKLANGEVAVVVRRGGHAHTPVVCGLVAATGMPLGEAVARDTAFPKYAVASLTTKPRVVFEPARLFGLVGGGQGASSLVGQS